MSPTALQVHRDALTVDGLVFMGDGSTETLEAGNVAAANVTVCHFEGDFEQACNEMAEWHARGAAPDRRWRLLERGWSEAELRGFPGENLLRALDLARAPP